MIENEYSKRKFNEAEKETLSPEDMEKLKEFRSLQSRWEKIDGDIRAGAETSGATTESILSFLEGFIELMKPRQFAYVVGVGGVEQTELENKYAETKKGQIELAHTEAVILNDELGARTERLKKAIPNGKNNPKELEEALSDFREMMKELNEGNLKKYSDAVSMKKQFSTRPFGSNEPEVVFPGALENDEEGDEQRPVFSSEDSDADRVEDD
jgi:hypothetical protein